MNFDESEQRIQILFDGDVISKEVYSDCKKVIGILKDSGREYDNEKMGIFITHIAMALQRISKGEIESPVGDEIVNQMKTDSDYDTAKNLLNQIQEQINQALPDVEKDYLMIHLCNLLK